MLICYYKTQKGGVIYDTSGISWDSDKSHKNVVQFRFQNKPELDARKIYPGRKWLHRSRVRCNHWGKISKLTSGKRKALPGIPGRPERQLTAASYFFLRHLGQCKIVSFLRHILSKNNSYFYIHLFLFMENISIGKSKKTC